MKQKHFIDAHKSMTFFVCLGLMHHYNQWENTTLWVYTALHGTYGVLWTLKSQIFPDKQWEQECSIFYGLYMFFGLLLYWASPLLIALQGANLVVPPAFLCGIITMWGIGVFYHFTSDMEKDISLKLNPGKLFTTGLWARCRNPNYFGELLIYLSFALLPGSPYPPLFLLAFILIVWVPNMLKKDRSLSRHPGYAEYKKRSSILIPLIL